MRKFLRENIVLALGMSLPLLLVALFMLANAFSGAFIENPRYDFLFYDGDYNQIEFEVVNEKLNLKITPNRYGNYKMPALYRYNVATGQAQRLTYREPPQSEWPVVPTEDNGVNANITIPIDPAKPPNDTQAQQTSKAVNAIRKSSGVPPFKLFPITELADLRIDNANMAPDGYRFAPNGRYFDGGGLWFVWGWSSSYRANRPALVKSGKRVPIAYNTGDRYDYRTPRFIGWITP